MQASYDEIRRMSFRALDAGGAAAGIDEDSAHAIAWLEAAGLPGLATLADALDRSDPTSRAAGIEHVSATSSSMELDANRNSAVFYAASVIDLLVASALTSSDGRAALALHAARHPVMLAASGARFCPQGAEISITWNGVQLTIENGDTFLAENGAEAAEWLDPSAFDVDLSCTLHPDPAQVPPGSNLTDHLERSFHNGIDVDDAAHARIATYAAKILVPESDASRLSGAGAGLTDND